MAIEGPVSKYKKNTLKIWIAVCIVGAAYCAYDGFYNEKFIDKHTDSDGKADSTLLFNQKSPPFFIGAAVLLTIWLVALKNKKIIADDDELIISSNRKIPYDSIEKIDKTYFEQKGYFTISYRDSGGREAKEKLDDRKYDNLSEILDFLISKIS